MPTGTPSVPCRLPGSQYKRWVEIYTRLGVERIDVPGLAGECSRRQRTGGPDARSRLGGQRQANPSLHQLPRWNRHRRPGDLRHDAVREKPRGDDLRRAGGQHGRLPAGSRHQDKRLALGGASKRQASEIEIEAREILRIRNMLNHTIADMTGQPLEKIVKDTDSDYFLSAAEAKDYGLIDRVIAHPCKA
jgi:ATP-dependent Clp protease protease subunit